MIFIKKEGPPLIIEVYVDGRAGVFMPEPPRFREKLLSYMFVNALKRKRIDLESVKPGRYNFNYTKLSILHLEAELEPVEE